MPTIPIVSARPCKNVRDVVPQIRFSGRSTTAKTHEPAHNTMTTQVMIAPMLRSENAPIVSRRNLLNRDKRPRRGEHSTAGGEFVADREH